MTSSFGDGTIRAPTYERQDVSENRLTLGLEFGYNVRLLAPPLVLAAGIRAPSASASDVSENRLTLGLTFGYLFSLLTPTSSFEDTNSSSE